MLAVCICGSASGVRAGPIADVAADFSSSENPNGVWSYGWSTSPGSAFVLSTEPAVREGLDTWPGNLAPDGNPAAYHNGTEAAILLNDSALFEPGQFALHPGPGGEYAVLRYTAPDAGFAFVASTFSGFDIFSTTTDVHVLHNGVVIFDALVEGFGATSAVVFDSVIPVLLGDEIDFAVGFGAPQDSSYFNDTTGLAATISLNPVPEPSTALLLGLGLAGVGRFMRRR